MPLFLNRLLMQISMVSSREMLVKSDSMSKLTIKLMEYLSLSTTSIELPLSDF